MGRFLKGIAVIFFLSGVSIYFLSLGVKLFYREIHKRNKTDISGQKFDVVFLGSSRTIHHINAELFSGLTEKSSLNMGWAACNPSEIYAATKIYLSQNKKPEIIAIQLDLEHNLVEIDELAKQSLLKYTGLGIVDDYFSEELKIKSKVPLLLNSTNRDYGWREVLKTVFKNNLYSDPSSKKFGYVPIIDNHYKEAPNEAERQIEKLVCKKNIWIEKTVQFCKSQGIKVVLFVSPYYTNSDPEQFNYFSVYGCPSFNLSNLLSQKSFFRDQSHLNEKGADSFTRVFADSFNNLMSRK
jgi:hypothetical protein